MSKKQISMVGIAIGLAFCGQAFASQVPDTCKRVVSAGEEAANKKLSEHIKEARKAYRLYKDLYKECKEGIESIPVAEISKIGNLPAFTPEVNAIAKVLVDNYVMPIVEDQIRSVCKDANDEYEGKIDDFMKKNVPRPVARTGREAERRVKDYERELEKSQEEEAPSKQVVSTASFKKIQSLSVSQESLIDKVKSSKEFQQYQKQYPYEAPAAPKQVAPSQPASSTLPPPSSINDAYQRSLSSTAPKQSVPARSSVQPAASSQPASAPPSRSTSGGTTYKAPSSSQKEAGESSGGSSYFKNMFGGK